MAALRERGVADHAAAAGEGSAAAIAINADLVEEDVRDAVLAFAGTRPATARSNTPTRK